MLTSELQRSLADGPGRRSRGLQNRVQALELKGEKTIGRAGFSAPFLIYVARGGRRVRCPRTRPHMIELCRRGVPAASEVGDRGQPEGISYSNAAGKR